LHNTTKYLVKLRRRSTYCTTHQTIW